jgi:hypothetical protein
VRRTYPRAHPTPPAPVTFGVSCWTSAGPTAMRRASAVSAAHRPRRRWRGMSGGTPGGAAGRQTTRRTRSMASPRGCMRRDRTPNAAGSRARPRTCAQTHVCARAPNLVAHSTRTDADAGAGAVTRVGNGGAHRPRRCMHPRARTRAGTRGRRRRAGGWVRTQRRMWTWTWTVKRAWTWCVVVRVVCRGRKVSEPEATARGASGERSIGSTGGRGTGRHTPRARRSSGAVAQQLFRNSGGAQRGEGRQETEGGDGAGRQRVDERRRTAVRSRACT